MNENGKKIKVLLVDDSPIALTALQRIFAGVPDIEVVGTARSGREALRLIPSLKPTLICTDLYMPFMDGLELTREIMSRFPCPILVISVSVSSDDPHNVFDLLEAGALDVFPKPRAGLDPHNRENNAALIRKIRTLSGVSVFTRPRSIPPQPMRASPHADGVNIVAIGASTGGPQALATILSLLPVNYPAPVLCVQHIAEGFLMGLIDWLDRHCKIRIKMLQEGEFPQPGTVYFPRENRDMIIDDYGRLTSSLPLPEALHCPSVDVTFESVARSYGKRAAGVLLSGMGNDGARGLLTISQAGGLTIAQDEATCVVFGMPASAIALGGAQRVLPIQAIGTTLIEIATARRPEVVGS